MKRPKLPYRPQRVLEMLYHRELGYLLFYPENTGHTLSRAFLALNLEVTKDELVAYRDLFIEFGWARFSGRYRPDKCEPAVRLTDLGFAEAKKSVLRRRPIYSPARLRTYDWEIFGSAAAITAALFSIAAFFQGSCNA